MRLRRMAESIECVRLLLTEDVANFEGEFFTLTEAYCNPKPVQARPPIWVGASGEQIGLKLAGKHGDAWNVPFVSPEDFARKRRIVLDHAPDPDRFVTGVNLLYVPCEPDEVDAALAERFGPMGPAMAPGALVGDLPAITDRLGRYVDAGAEWVILALPPRSTSMPSSASPTRWPLSSLDPLVGEPPGGRLRPSGCHQASCSGWRLRSVTGRWSASLPAGGFAHPGVIKRAAPAGACAA